MTEKSIYRLSDFDFDLPGELIAQFPEERRDRSRLLVLHRGEGRIEHRHFNELAEYLRDGDMMVLNDARVLHARVIFRRETGGAVEFILTRRLDEHRWRAICNRTKRIRCGEILSAWNDPGIRARVIGKDGDGIDLFAEEALDDEILGRIGTLPLPPYIRRGAGALDEERYQTVYARRPGAVASPTAGLHFTDELFERIERMGVERAFLTLFVSWGTFQPVRAEDLSLHRMHTELYDLPKASASRINAARAAGRRILSVGTTSLRVLEATYREGANVPGSGETDLFIYPPRGTESADALLTNFHTPRSTLLMLVCSFAGYDPVMSAYRAAVAERYRFFSYGDAMLII